MNVLLIGGSSPLINLMIQNAGKEGCKVFLLTGDRYHEEWYEKVFERYDFPYDAANISEVIESADPDVIIALGAYDSLYHWKYAEKEAVRYISGLTSLLMAFSSRRKGRFIYLSSSEIYDGIHTDLIDEDTPGDGFSYKSMALVQAESICETYRISQGADIVTLRLDGLYHTPQNPKDIMSPVETMCLTAFRDHTITIEKEKTYSLLFMSDAIQFIKEAALAKSHQYPVYNISSCITVNEENLASMVLEAAKLQDIDSIQVISKQSSPSLVVLNNMRFQEEFGINRTADLQYTLNDILRYMSANPEVFLYDQKNQLSLRERILKKSGWFFKAAIPFLENLILFIPFFMLNNRAVGSAYFSRIDFYLLYVLLFAIIYGQQQAAVSAVLATMGFIFREMYNRTGYEVLLDYNTYVWIAQLFVVGLSVGYLRDQLKKNQYEAKEDHDYMAVQLGDIKDINDSNVRVKDSLSKEIVSQADSIGKVYEITQSLDRYSFDEVLFYAADVLKKLMLSDDIAIYSTVGGPYARLFTATSARAMSLGKSMKYQELEPVYREISNKKVFINKQLDPSLPSMANAIFDGNEMRTIIMIWDIPWERMTLGEADRLAVISMLIQNSVVRATRYLNAIHSERYIENTEILKEKAFQNMLQAYVSAAEKELTIFTVVRIRHSGMAPIDEAVGVKKSLRASDYVGIIQNKVYALLTNTSPNEAKTAIKRLNDKGFSCRILEVSHE